MAYLERRSQRPWRSERTRAHASQTSARSRLETTAVGTTSERVAPLTRTHTHTQAGAMSLIQGLISVLLLAFDRARASLGRAIFSSLSREQSSIHKFS